MHWTNQQTSDLLPNAGYHYSREQLDKMEDPEEAHARRGAHWTYDAEAFIDAIQALKGSSKLYHHGTDIPRKWAAYGNNGNLLHSNSLP